MESLHAESKAAKSDMLKYTADQLASQQATKRLGDTAGTGLSRPDRDLIKSVLEENGEKVRELMQAGDN